MDKKSSRMIDKLRTFAGAVKMDAPSVHDSVIRTSSPSFNFLFGNSHGLPQGYALLLYGPPRGGKSVICNDMIGQLHRDDPEAVAVKFNTEFRESGQLGEKHFAMYGIDPDRYVAYETNHPAEIFDRIETELAAMIQDGLKIKLVIIDSLNQIQGRRTNNADTVMQQQIGDEAKTIQDGLKRIMPLQHRLGFSLICTSHIRAQMDLAEQMRGNKVRPAVSHYTQHHCEYYIMVEPNRSKDGKADLLGNKYEMEGAKDVMGNSERTGHRIRAKMVDSSVGPKNRVAEFSFDYHHGIMNQHEEVFLLGVNRGVIKKPNNITYSYAGKDYRGKPAMLQALKDDKSMQDAIMTELRRQDILGDYADIPKDVVESSVEEE